MSSWQMFFFGGGKCPNLGVVNVRFLGVVNDPLANNLTPFVFIVSVIVNTQETVNLIRNNGWRFSIAGEALAYRQVCLSSPGPK